MFCFQIAEKTTKNNVGELHIVTQIAHKFIYSNNIARNCIVALHTSHLLIFYSGDLFMNIRKIGENARTRVNNVYPTTFYLCFLIVHIAKCAYLLFGAFIKLIFFCTHCPCPYQRNAISILLCMAYMSRIICCLMMTSSGFFAMTTITNLIAYMAIQCMISNQTRKKHGEKIRQICFLLARNIIHSFETMECMV